MNQTPWLTRLFLPLAGAHPLSVSGFFRPPLHLPTFVAVLMVIKLINLTLTARIQVAFSPDSDIYRLIEAGTNVATVLLLLSIALAVGARLFFKVTTPRLALPLMILYLTIATINVSGSAATLVFSNRLVQESQARLVTDIGLAYAMVVLVFSLWYQLVDGHLRGGGLDFTRNAAHPDQPPNWFDYLVLSFTVCSASGSTFELARTRPVKALMMLETMISMTILVLAVARIIQAA